MASTWWEDGRYFSRSQSEGVLREWRGNRFGWVVRAETQSRLEKKMADNPNARGGDRPCDTEPHDHLGRGFISSDPEWPMQQVVQRPEVPAQRAPLSSFSLSEQRKAEAENDYLRQANAALNPQPRTIQAVTSLRGQVTFIIDGELETFNLAPHMAAAIIAMLVNTLK